VTRFSPDGVRTRWATSVCLQPASVPRGYRVASSTLRGLVPLGTAVGGACRGSQGNQRRTCALQPSRMLPPSRPAWSAIDSGQTARGLHTATLLTPGSVVVAGGTNVPGLRSG
jgi:hypothetical protein